jgi:hypothetical protein
MSINLTIEELKTEIKKVKPDIKDSSLIAYVNQLTKLKSLFNAKNYGFILEPEKVYKKLDESVKSDLTKKNYISPIMILLRTQGDEYKDLIEIYNQKIKQISEDYKKQNNEGVISEKQKPNFISYSELEKYIKKIKNDITPLKKATFISSQDRDLFQIYMILEFLIRYPLRNDLSGMKLLTKTEFNKLKEKTENYLVKEKNKMIVYLYEYKTNKTYGEIKFEIDKSMKTIFNMYIKRLDLKNGDYLLQQVRDKSLPLSPNKLSQMLINSSQKYIDKNISTTMIRKIVVSEKFSKYKDEQQLLSHIMGHSPSVQNAIYVKKI